MVEKTSELPHLIDHIAFAQEPKLMKLIGDGKKTTAFSAFL